MVTINRDRYVVFHLISNTSKIEESIIKSSIWRTYQTIFGLYGSSSAGLHFEDYNEEDKTGIIRCTHTSLSQLLTVLAFITEIRDIKILFQIMNVSGTINKAKKMLATK